VGGLPREVGVAPDALEEAVDPAHTEGNIGHANGEGKAAAPPVGRSGAI
jgi:hypothetical protein